MNDGAIEDPSSRSKRRASLWPLWVTAYLKTREGGTREAERGFEGARLPQSCRDCDGSRVEETLAGCGSVGSKIDAPRVSKDPTNIP